MAANDFYMSLLGTNLAPWLQASATIFDAVTTYRAGDLARIHAQREARAKKFEQAQAERDAIQAFAAEQRKMLEERRVTEATIGRAVAVAGASGAGASDNTVMRIVADIAATGAYQESIHRYRGEQRARKLREQGRVLGLEADQAISVGEDRRRAAKIRTAGTVIRGATSLYEKYGPHRDIIGDSALIE